MTIFCLAPQGGNDTTYVCANKNGVVKFFGAVLNNGMLKKQEVRISDRGKKEKKKSRMDVGDENSLSSLLSVFFLSSKVSTL